ncbi:hypothetical protein [Fischerella sp.]|nr:hypothetical protein [Fischerella sp.]
MTQQTQPSKNLFEPIKPPKVSEDLLPLLIDILQPPPPQKQPKN